MMIMMMLILMEIYIQKAAGHRHGVINHTPTTVGGATHIHIQLVCMGIHVHVYARAPILSVQC